MLQKLKDYWHSFVVWIDGWKTKLTAILLFGLNMYDALAAQLEPAFKLFSDETRPFVTMVLAILVYIFRNMANVTQKAEDAVEPSPKAN